MCTLTGNAERGSIRYKCWELMRKNQCLILLERTIAVYEKTKIDLVENRTICGFSYFPVFLLSVECIENLIKKKTIDMFAKNPKIQTFLIDIFFNMS